MAQSIVIFMILLIVSIVALEKKSVLDRDVCEIQNEDVLSCKFVRNCIYQIPEGDLNTRVRIVHFRRLQNSMLIIHKRQMPSLTHIIIDDDGECGNIIVASDVKVTVNGYECVSRNSQNDTPPSPFPE